MARTPASAAMATKIKKVKRGKAVGRKHDPVMDRSVETWSHRKDGGVTANQIRDEFAFYKRRHENPKDSYTFGFSRPGEVEHVTEPNVFGECIYEDVKDLPPYEVVVAKFINDPPATLDDLKLMVPRALSKHFDITKKQGLTGTNRHKHFHGKVDAVEAALQDGDVVGAEKQWPDRIDLLVARTLGTKDGEGMLGADLMAKMKRARLQHLVNEDAEVDPVWRGNMSREEVRALFANQSAGPSQPQTPQVEDEPKMLPVRGAAGRKRRGGDTDDDDYEDENGEDGDEDIIGLAPYKKRRTSYRADGSDERMETRPPLARRRVEGGSNGARYRESERGAESSELGGPEGPRASTQPRFPHSEGAAPHDKRHGGASLDNTIPKPPRRLEAKDETVRSPVGGRVAQQIQSGDGLTLPSARRPDLRVQIEEQRLRLRLERERLQVIDIRDQNLQALDLNSRIRSEITELRIQESTLTDDLYSRALEDVASTINSRDQIAKAEALSERLAADKINLQEDRSELLERVQSLKAEAKTKKLRVANEV